ncbi:hypothetical protein Tco_1547410 [Tanacetum coccineum]
MTANHKSYNHLIGECPKPPKDKNQRAFVRGSWSDSGEEDDEKVKDEMCLVAHASSEVCSESSYFSDENSSIDDFTLDNEYDNKSANNFHGLVTAMESVFMSQIPTNYIQMQNMPGSRLGAANRLRTADAPNHMMGTTESFSQFFTRNTMGSGKDIKDKKKQKQSKTDKKREKTKSRVKNERQSKPDQSNTARKEVKGQNNKAKD